jgi:A/G-specific adenine glycosylase
MKNTTNQHPISNILIDWYKTNKRDLPWRNIDDPYKIWISEIILQQTRVNQGTSYYLRFIERFPTVAELAKSDEDEVLKYWQGLGYYSRARNLHKAAKQIITIFDGKFPTEHSDILSLAGVGEYTASAISSFAYNNNYAVVDGNVFRFLSRLFGIETPIDTTSGKKEFTNLAHEILFTIHPGIHNQAIMEFGALQCVPNSPNCNICPLNNTCRAFQTNSIATLPIKSKKTKTQNRYFNYLFINYQNFTFVQKRTIKDIWQNLYEFPLIESNHLLTDAELTDHDSFKAIFEGITKIEISKKTNPMKHVLSHRVIYAQFRSITIDALGNNLENFIKVPISAIDNYPVSRLMELFLENLHF